jgi:hypothetical protein
MKEVRLFGSRERGRRRRELILEGFTTATLVTGGARLQAIISQETPEPPFYCK